MRNLEVVADGEAMAWAAARRFVDLAQTVTGTEGQFSVALAGGSTPERMHELLAQAPLTNEVDWAKVHIFFGDERFLFPDDPATNVHMARRTLLSKVPIPEHQVYPFETVDTSPAAAARNYEAGLEAFFGPSPRFDLILLGMGPDGHTASLFPGFPQVKNPPDSLAAAVFDAPKAPPTRLTLTLKTLNAAKNVIFLVGGNSKAEAVREVFSGDSSLPATLVQPVGKLTWLLDEAAAKGLM